MLILLSPPQVTSLLYNTISDCLSKSSLPQMAGIPYFAAFLPQLVSLSLPSPCNSKHFGCIVGNSGSSLGYIL